MQVIHSWLATQLLVASLPSMNLKEDAQKAQQMFANAKRLLCVCHRNPDGDALGSALAMAMLLESHYPDTPVTVHCVDAVPETFVFLPGSGRFLGAPETKKGDCVVFVDCAEAHMTQLHISHPQLFDGSIPTVSLDHHHTNPGFATLNFIDAESASTCEIILHLAVELQWKITPDIATCLLTGVYTDTGGLLHSNTSSQVYRTVGTLLRLGAKHQLLVTSVFRTAKLSTLKLWGRVLEKISISEEGGAISALTEGDFKASGADHSQLDGAIDYVNAVPGMRFSLILSERDGKVKGSLRTLRDDVDVSAMASRLKGGGHKKAAGFAVEGKLQPEVRWKVVERESGASK